MVLLVTFRYVILKSIEQKHLRKKQEKEVFFLKRVVDVVVEAPFIVTMVKRTEHIWGLV